LPEDFLGGGTKQVYREVRKKVKRLKGDAPLDEDILKIRKLIESRKLGGILSSLSEG